MRESISWMADGACVGLDPEAWFPAPGEKVPAAVRKICQRCPVRLECAEYAINNESRIEGVWGGLSYNERVKIRYARGIRTQPPLEPCGTVAAQRRHQRRGEVCGICRRAAYIEWSLRDEDRRRSG